MSLRLKMLILLLLLLFFIVCNSNEATIAPTILSPIITTTSNANNEELQIAAAFKKAMNDMVQILRSDEPFIKNMKKILDASRMCGIVFNHGVSTWNEMKSHVEIRNAIHSFVPFRFRCDGIIREISGAEAFIASRHEIVKIQKAIIFPLENLIKLFEEFRFKKEDIGDIKIGCKWYDPADILFSIENEIIFSNPSAIVAQDDYSDLTFENLKLIFQNSLKLTITMFPFCENFLNGRHSSSFRSHKAADVLKRVHKKFIIIINTSRKENFWKDDIIKRLIKKHVDNGTKIVAQPASPLSGNFRIQRDIYDDLTKSYGSLGYYYHVIVNDAAQLGHNDTIIQCSTECHYLYNFLGKDIYVMRSQKADNYSTCDHLKKYNSQCFVKSNSTNSLEPLAKDIAGNCSNNIVAFSIIRNRLNVEDSFMHYGNYGYAWKCYEDVSILIAFKPFYA